MSRRTKPNRNTHYAVTNLRGTSELECKCGSWLAHWRIGAGSLRATCAVFGCGDEAEVGAHVVSADGRTDRQFWIAPFCRAHNIHTNDRIMYLKQNVRLVSANKRITCLRRNWPPLR